MLIKHSMLLIIPIFSLNIFAVGTFQFLNDYGNPISAYAFYEKSDKLNNNCMVMIPNYYSYYYSNSTTSHSIEMSSVNSSMNYLTEHYNDPLISFSAYINNSSAQEVAESHITSVTSSKTTIYKNAEKTTFLGYTAYRVSFLSTAVDPAMHYDYFYFDKEGQCFKFGYRIANDLLTVSKEDTILNYISKAIVFLNNTGTDKPKLSKSSTVPLARLTQKGNTVTISNIEYVYIFNALGEMLNTINRRTLNNITTLQFNNKGFYIIKAKSYSSNEFISRLIIK